MQYFDREVRIKKKKKNQLILKSLLKKYNRWVQKCGWCCKLKWLLMSMCRSFNESSCVQHIKSFAPKKKEQ